MLSTNRLAVLRIFGAFLVGFVLTVILAAILPTPRDARYEALTGDARQLTNVYARLATDPKPIDVAFIGTSRTMNGIDDKGIEVGLARAGLPLSVANLGVPWPGRDLELLLVKQLLAWKSPRLIIIELDQYEVPYGHVLLPYVADASDMFCCKSYLNYKFFPSFLAFLRRRVRGAIAPVWQAPQDARPVAPVDTWVPKEGVWDAQQAAASLQEARQEGGLPGRLKQLYVQWAAPFGLGAVRQIADLAAGRGAKVAFLYLPARHYLIDGASPVNAAFYREFGPILPAPKDIAAEDRNWADWAHLNPAGARLLVPCLVADIARLDAAGSGTEEARVCGGLPSGKPFASRQ